MGDKVKKHIEWYEEFYGTKYVYESPSSDLFIDSRTKDDKSACSVDIEPFPDGSEDDESTCSVDSELFPDGSEDDESTCSVDSELCLCMIMIIG